MAITSIELTNFRSYPERSFKLDPDVTLITGPNGSGKTNILEAVYVLSTTKSFRAKDESLIYDSKDYYRLLAADGDELVQFSYQSQPTRVKKIVRGGVKKTLRGHIGTIPVVLFEPSDLNLLVGPPKARRDYIDTILCQTDQLYLAALTEYKRVLRQRNALLASVESPGADMLFVWNMRLSGPALVLHESRRDFLGYLSERVAELYSKIAGRQHHLELHYSPSPGSEVMESEESFIAYLDSMIMRDQAAHFTTSGPHRDDFSVVFDNKPIGAVASRGEHRSVVLALKLAELEYQSQYAKHKPLFMLDDVFSELDDARRGFLLNTIGNYQTIVTTTEADSLADHNYYTIKLEAPHE